MPITRRAFLVAASAAAGAAWSPRLLALQGGQPPTPTAPPPVYTFTPLRNEVGIFTGQGGTIAWLVSRDGVVVVDAQMGAAAAAGLAGIRERAGQRMIDLLFNTHHHFDHTDGNSVFRPATRKIVAHQNVPALQKRHARPGTEGTQVVAEATFGKVWSEAVGRERVTAVHYGPAHTGGDGVVTFERANVVHVGDLVFNRRMPVTDRPGGCQISGWIKVLEQIAKDHGRDTLYVFGHGKPGLPPTGTRADVLLQRNFLEALLAHVRTEIAAGKTREQIVKGAPELRGFAEHGAVTERVLAAAHDEISGVPVQ